MKPASSKAAGAARPAGGGIVPDKAHAAQLKILLAASNKNAAKAGKRSGHSVNARKILEFINSSNLKFC
ncbi:hypothetical protein [Dyella flagellata]|uniref:hypothetical protein n=1 Tax=Dyella flagellata TaxID=1867833 RepID=UPI0024E16D86|nr:hypothetical protein [Dyella flagellata]